MNPVFAKEAEIALRRMSDIQKIKMIYHGKKIYIGHEMLEGWSDMLPFYLFWCEDCEHFAKDYPHGHVEIQHLNCSSCGIYHAFQPWWVSWKNLWEIFKFSVINRR